MSENCSDAQNLGRYQNEFICSKPVSQSCTVARSEIFWQATGQSNLADRMEDCSNGQSAVVRVRKPNFGSFAIGSFYVKFGYPVARQSCSLLASVHDCETGL